MTKFSLLTAVLICGAGALTPAIAEEANPEKKAPAKEKKEADGVKKELGTFTGIEEGDYLHWNMKTEAGKEGSFFLLQPDESVGKVMEAPEKFVGKICRVKWKTTTEEIPESGGKLKVDEVLSVEWIEKNKSR